MKDVRISQEELKELTGGERLYPGFMYEHSRQDHEARYFFAAKYIASDMRVLDAACGSGYGSKILARLTKSVVGLDVSDHAVEYATDHFGNEHISFFVADLVKKIDFPNGHFDCIVSFETFEHVTNQDAMLTEFKRVLKPGGILIISTPDKNIHQHVDPNNKFHLREFTKDEFVAELSKYFSVRELYGKNPYQKLSFFRRALRASVKIFNRLDVWKLRRLLIPQKYKERIVRSMDATTEQARVYPLDMSAPNTIYDDLIAICEAI